MKANIDILSQDWFDEIGQIDTDKLVFDLVTDPSVAKAISSFKEALANHPDKDSIIQRTIKLLFDEVHS